MYEHLASFRGGDPNEKHFALYRRWAQGGWGMVITGNVQVSPMHMTLGRDTRIPTRSSKAYGPSLNAFKDLCSAIHGSKPKTTRPMAIMQLNHVGRQSPRFIGGRAVWERPVGVSSTPVGHKTREGWMAWIVYKLLFQKPKALSTAGVIEVIDQFVAGALFALDAGFDGVQIHASHGYLLAQFMSAKLNNRSDRYRKGFNLILDIISAIRRVVPPEFAVGVKLNSGDYVHGGLSESDAADNMRKLSASQVDFIEISGGDYEAPDFMTASVSPRQAFFRKFSKLTMKALEKIPEKTRPLVILTGGLRRKDQMAYALEQKECDLLGLGRPSVLCPELPQKMKDGSLEEDSLREPALKNLAWMSKLVGAGVGTAWYNVQMHRLAESRKIDRKLGSLGAVVYLWVSHPWMVATRALLLLACRNFLCLLTTGMRL